MNKFCLFFCCMIIVVTGFGQQVFTLQNAIDRAINNNFSIRIARNQSEIINNNASPGNAGMLPSINAAGGYTVGNNYTIQEYSDGSHVEKGNASQTVLNGSVTLDWVLFDGLKMFASYDRLKSLSEQGKIDLKIEMESVIENVYKSYYAVVRETQLLDALEESFGFYEDRLSIAEKKFSIGSSSKLDFLQAKVDRNAQQSAILHQQQNLRTVQTELNRLLVFTADSVFALDDTMQFSYNPDYNSLVSNLSNNYTLQSSEKNIGINKFVLNELKGLRLPVISGNAGYYYNNNKNDAGLFSRNQTQGPQFGITANYNLFSGFNTSRQIKNAKLAFENAQLLHNQTTQFIQTDLLIAYDNYRRAKEMLALEEDNIGYARENASVFTESFRLGSANTLQVKQAHESLNNALARLVTARYNCKLAEITLMRLSGQLVK